MESNRVERFVNRLGSRLRPVPKVVTAIVFIVISLEITSFLTLWISDKVAGEDFQQGSVNDPRVEIDVYADADWAEQYFQEFAAAYSTRYSPYTGYRRRPNFHGKYINLDEQALRRTVPDCSDGSADSLQIFVMGGSAAWGTGARDKATIPSLLAARLCEIGVPVKVTNFGESGYTNSQELIQLIIELRKRHVPDIVLFYDGINDAYSSYQNRIPGLPQNISSQLTRYKIGQQSVGVRNLVQIALLTNSGQLAKRIVSRLQRRRDGAVGQLSDSEWKPIDEGTVSILRENIRIIRGLESLYGFKSFFYWQPALYTKDVLSRDEADKIEKDPAFDERYRRITELIQHEAAIRDLSNIFDRYERTFFIDEFHVSEEGNAIVAEILFEDVMDYLKATCQNTHRITFSLSSF